MELNLKNIKTESDNFEYSGQTITTPISSQTIPTKPTSVFSIENLLKDNKKLYNTSNISYRYEKNPAQFENYRPHYYKPLVETSSNHEADSSSSSYPIIDDEEIISSDDENDFDEQLDESSLNDSGLEIKNSDEVVSTSNEDFNRDQPKNLNHSSFNPAAFVFYVLGNQLGTMSPYLVILSEEGYYQVPKISSNTVAWLSSTYNIGIVPGAIIGTYANDIFGRKLSMILFTIPGFLSQVFQYFAMDISMVFISYFLRGVISSWAFIVVPTYVSEIASPHLRGAFTVLSVLFTSIGMLSGSLIQASLSIELTAVIGGVSVLVTLMIVFVVLETPYFFMTKNQDEKCRESLRKFRCGQNIDKEFEEIKIAWIETIRLKHIGWSKIFSVRSNLKVFFICVGVQTCQQFTGHTLLVTNIHIVVQHSGLDLSLPQISIIAKGVEFLANILSIFIVDSWGRRPLFLFVSLGACIAHLITGFAFFIGNINAEMSTALGITAFIGNLIYLSMAGLGLKHLPNVLSAELFPTDIKSKGCSSLMVVSALQGALVTQLFDLLSHIGYYMPFFGLSVCGFLCFIFGIMWVPETKTKSLSEIQKQLNV